MRGGHVRRFDAVPHGSGQVGRLAAPSVLDPRKVLRPIRQAPNVVAKSILPTVGLVAGQASVADEDLVPAPDRFGLSFAFERRLGVLRRT